MGGAARFVRTLIPRGRYLPFGSCPCRSRGFDTWRPPAVQGHGGFATPTAEAAPPILFRISVNNPQPPAAIAVGLSLPCLRRRVGVAACRVYIGVTEELQS